MPYIGSYIWKIRQKIGHDLLVTPCTEAVAVRDGKILMVYNKDFDSWAIPGGYAEDDGASWREIAARELSEEGGVEVDPSKMKLFAIASGLRITYKSGDQTQIYSNFFVVDEFIREVETLDEVEIAKKQWFTLDEAEKLEISPGTRLVLPAYRRYLETGEVQIVEVDAEGRVSLA
jgi:8-oxo-dGTP pyrophosphatase MutT (NUDIX family)